MASIVASPAALADPSVEAAAPGTISERVPFDPNDLGAQCFCTGTTEALYQPDFTNGFDPMNPEYLPPIPSDPTHVDVDGQIIDFAKIFGQRLEDLQTGKTIPLYTNQADQTQVPPVCSMRLETDSVTGDAFAMTEWIYCSQRDNSACILTDSEGRVYVGDELTDAQAATDSGAAGLSEEQQLVVSYLLQHDMVLPLVPEALLPGVSGTLGTPEGAGYRASNANSLERQVRHQLVWCVTDMYEQKVGYNTHVVAWCNDLGLGPDGELFRGFSRT